ncbi:hypothetical protein ABZX85_49275 [Streptomyces sp. NPDC004539]|uniref:hypothetical protein n=1 Tax=Streptomyces sp. NPDC004539 TaxID=3154280 RepID=UPI0033B0424B
MSSTATVPSPTGRLRARVLVPLAGSLVPAVYFGPHLLAADASQGGFGDQGRLVGAVKEGFVRYWAAGRADYSPELGGVVDYWFRFHLAKAALSALLLAVLVALGVVVWRAFLRSGGARRAGLAVSGVVVGALGLLSLVVAAANVQGAVAPFTSVLTMLPTGTRTGALGGTLEQVRAGLGSPESAPPALAVMIGDNTRYHVTMAVVSAVVAVGFVAVSVLLWRRFTGTADRRARRLLGVFGSLGVGMTLVVLVVGAANVSVAADSARGLSEFFGA